METFDAKKTAAEIIEWIRAYFDENGKGCAAVVGISGGKDSSVVAALCARALGADRVWGVLLPRGEQWDIGVSRDLADFLGIRRREIDIEKCADSVLAAMREGGLEPDAQAAVNVPARVRMLVLYAAATTVGGRVANTCNLSEDWVGYSTKFGDSAGDFSPLSRLTVTEVKVLGRELGLPARFVDKTPEDGLTGRSDEDNLGFSYDVLDRYIREGICEDAKAKGRIDELRRRNLHKLAPMPCYEPDAATRQAQ